MVILTTRSRVTHTPITLDVLGSLLEMARKYDDIGVFDEMSCIVAKEFPRTLKAWDSAAKAPFRAIGWTAGIEFDLVALANTFDLLTALPSLWYRICCHFTPVRIRRCLIYVLANGGADAEAGWCQTFERLHGQAD
jgi:hypothetical protein